MFVVIAIGLSTINKAKTQQIIMAIASLSSFVTLFFINNYYTQVKKEQWREIAIAVTEQGDAYMYVSEVDQFFNFYFRILKKDKIVVPLSGVTNEMLLTQKGIWILYAHDPESADGIMPPAFLGEEFSLAKGNTRSVL